MDWVNINDLFIITLMLLNEKPIVMMKSYFAVLLNISKKTPNESRLLLWEIKYLMHY